MKTKILFLLFLLALTLFTRFWDLNHFPPSLFSDEVDAGYQAMIFNHSGTDYYGNKLPVHFHSFSDWRTSGLIYSIAFFQKIGVNPELSVRLPSAVFSLISVFLIYLITDSPIAAFLLAISPWAIHYGRTGFEVSGMIMVILAGIYFWQKFLKKYRLRFLLLSIFFFCLSPYFYSTANFFLPVIAIVLFLIWRLEILKLGFKKIFIAAIFGTILLIPTLMDTIHGVSGFRFSYIGIFTMPHREQVTDSLRYEDILLNHPNQINVQTPFISKILHNKDQLIAQKFVNNYFLSFSTDFLFLSGDNNLRQGFGGHGLLYLIDAPLVLLGLFFYFKKPDKFGTLFFWLLLLAPIPFALTRDSVSAHATRLILMLPSLIYFITKGVGKKYYLLPIYFLFFLSFWHYYTIHYPQTSAAAWHSGMKESILAANQYLDKKIYFSDTFEPFTPFFLFYHPYFPADNRPVSQHISHLQTDFFDGSTIDNQYFFGHLNWSKIPPDNNYLLIVPESEYQTIAHPSAFKVITILKKGYLSSSNFYLLSPND
jgi:hypothetical protein